MQVALKNKKKLNWLQVAIYFFTVNQHPGDKYPEPTETTTPHKTPTSQKNASPKPKYQHFSGQPLCNETIDQHKSHPIQRIAPPPYTRKGGVLIQIETRERPRSHNATPHNVRKIIPIKTIQIKCA